MLEPDTFESIVENAPMVSIDICLVCKGGKLLVKKNDQPLKGEWFTPGGGIFKNEPRQECIRRVVGSELGITIKEPTDFKPMGVWDHFYENSVMDENVSTHYVSLPHYFLPTERPKLSLDPQHDSLSWFGLDQVAYSAVFHKYMRIYTSWLINAGINND